VEVRGEEAEWRKCSIFHAGGQHRRGLVAPVANTISRY